MPLQQQLQFLLLLQHRPVSPILLLLVVVRVAAATRPVVRVVGGAAAALGLPLPLLYVLPPHLALLEVLVVPRLVPGVVDAHHAAPDGRAAEVVDGQVRAALVLVLEPAEAAALARLAFARQLEEDGLAELRENGDDVALGELEREAAKEDEGGVAVVDVPGGVGGSGKRATAGVSGRSGQEGRERVSGLTFPAQSPSC